MTMVHKKNIKKMGGGGGAKKVLLTNTFKKKKKKKRSTNDARYFCKKSIDCGLDQRFSFAKEKIWVKALKKNWKFIIFYCNQLIFFLLNFL